MVTKMSAQEIRLFVVEQLSALGIVDPSDEYVERLSESKNNLAARSYRQGLEWVAHSTREDCWHRTRSVYRGT